MNPNYKLLQSTLFNANQTSRLELIQFAIEKTNATSYLEVGCENDRIFSKINVPYKIGVDPVSGGNIRKTSDEFFETNTDFFDVIFVDGLHEYNQIKRDIENSFKFLNPNGIIILHDLLPGSLNESLYPRPKGVGGWSGDVWKISFDLVGDPNIDFKLVLIDQGCGVLMKGQNTKIASFDEKRDWQFFLNNWFKLPMLTLEELKLSYK